MCQERVGACRRGDKEISPLKHGSPPPPSRILLSNSEIPKSRPLVPRESSIATIQGGGGGGGGGGGLVNGEICIRV